MRRILSALLVLPAPLVAVLWLNSYAPGDWHIRSDDGRVFAFSVGSAGKHYLENNSAAEAWRLLAQGPVQTQVTRFDALGVGLVRHGEGSATQPFLAVSVSYVYAFAMTLLPLALAWHRRRRHRRAAGNRCADCGYDLRAHAAGGRCPECGADVKPVT